MLAAWVRYINTWKLT